MPETTKQAKKSKDCPKHPLGKLPKNKGLWEVPHVGCDYPEGGCDCYCNAGCKGEERRRPYARNCNA